jgi:iron complex transport system substrate-binding protein
MDKPSNLAESETMKRATIAVISVIIVVAILSGVFLFVYYQGRAEDSTIESLQNLKDDTGYVTSLSAVPERIVSLAPSNTEILFALGLGSEVVAVTDYCNYPYNFSAWIAAKNMTSVGDFSNPNMEVIASVNPDLIVATAGVQAETVAALRNLNYKVLVLSPSSVDGIFKDIELIGNATGKSDYAISLVSSLRSRIDAVTQKVSSVESKPKVYYEVWYPSPLMSAGSKSFQNEIIAKAGGSNIFADQDQDYFTTDVEAIIERNPDVILLPAEGMGMGSGPPFWGSVESVKKRIGWSTVNAVRTDRIFTVDGDAIARAGPRVVDSIEQLAALFHPELF